MMVYVCGMMEVILNIEKERVYEEVAKTTSYTGAKMTGDEEAYDRIFTTEEDGEMLDRFWKEACSAAVEQLKPFLVKDESGREGDCVLYLSLSASYSEALTRGVRASMLSYFVLYIVGKWYMFVNKDEAAGYLTDAAGMLADVMRKIYYRKRPERPNLGVQACKC